MNLTTAIMIGALMLGVANTAESASGNWTPSQSVADRCMVFLSGAQWAMLGKQVGASLDHMLGQVEIGRENEPTKAVIRAGVRAAYESQTPNENFHGECLESLRAEDMAKQESINRVKGHWMCQVNGSADRTQIWLSYNYDSTYSVGSPMKEWRDGSFTVDGDFVIEHLGGNPQWETQRRIAHDDNGVLLIQGLPCHPFVSSH